MKDYRKNVRLALVCFLLVVVLNFFLPRLLPGDPVAYLTGFSEQDMTPAQVAFYEDALHLNKPLAMQFDYYLQSLLDGTLGYSYKKDAAVTALIGEKIGYTLQITVPAVLLSAGIGLFWGLRCGYKKDSLADRFSTTAPSRRSRRSLPTVRKTGRRLQRSTPPGRSARTPRCFWTRTLGNLW